MSNTSKTALSAMAVALGTVFMLLSSAIPFFEYAIPAAAGFIVLFVESEVGKTWSFGTYVATSILGVFLVPNKEAVGIYIALFGLYPVIRSFFNKLPKIASYIAKCVYFVAAVLLAYFVMIKIFGIAQEMTEELNKITMPILIVCGLIAFIVYDRAMFLTEKKYKIRYHKYIEKLFRRR